MSIPTITPKASNHIERKIDAGIVVTVVPILALLFVAPKLDIGPY